MNEQATLPCRKCGAPNTLSNEYCRKCGAVLAVTTAEVRARRSPVLPTVKQIRWPLVFLGALITLGIMAILLGSLFLVAWSVFDVSSAGVAWDLGALTSDFLGMSIAAVAAFLTAFWLGGTAVAWVSKSRLILEPAIAAFLVLMLLGVIGSAMSEDIGIVAGVMLVPSAVLAALGGRLGNALIGEEGKR
jgi:H+/Cl- antiporter ClcA